MAKSGASENVSNNMTSLLNDDDIDNYFKKVLPTIAAAVKTSNGLPAGEHYDFYTTYKEFLDIMDVEGGRALSVLSGLLKQNGIRAPGILGSGSAESDADDKFEALIDANDQLTERISNKLDEFAGIRKAPEAELLLSSTPQARGLGKDGVTLSGASWNVKVNPAEKKTPTSYRLLAARFVQRPQTQFKEKIDNSDKPFHPKLTHKPNAVLPLRESLCIPHGEIGGVEIVPNPYKYEIERFEYTNRQLDPVINLTPPKPLRESGPLTFIDKPDQLEKLLDNLTKPDVSEIAIDLEAHNYRSYQGLTCLMQLSTRSHDYIIDTLALRSELTCLNPVFTDPNVVKVFHGADSDIVWLQRDFSLYIVNMFDTYQASKVLSLSRHSLAFLLKHYCQVDADKQYQLADWRIRPLPQEMIDYAREDTHYLLYIYDMMKNSLLEKGNDLRNLLISVLDNSRIVCGKVYQKPMLTDDGYHTFYVKSRKSFNNRQLLALSKLYEWRLRLAQQEDESTGFILPNHILLQICDVLPREPSGVLACCTPIPPLVRQHLHTIHSLLKEAREEPLSVSQTIRAEARLQAKATKSLLDSPHDTLSDVLPKPTTLPACCVRIGQVQSKKTSAWSFMASSLVSSLSEKVRKLKESFITPLTNYNPTKFIDYSAIFHQQNFKRPGDLLTPSVSASNTLNESSGLLDNSICDPPPIKRSKGDADNASTSAVGLEEGDADEADALQSKKDKRRKKKEMEAAKKSQPLRLRPASNPEKKLVAPNEDFEAYDYSKADYSEFKPPAAPRGKKFNKNSDKNQRSKNFKPDNEKSFTYRKNP